MSASEQLPFNFAGLEPQQSDVERSRVVIWPVPFEKTVSYGHGTKEGPQSIIAASRNMELYDDELKAVIADIGIHTLAPIDAEREPPAMMQALFEEAKRLLESDKFLCMLGGEHSITPPVARAHKLRHPGLSVLQIDAHADLRDTYDDTPLSHACAMRRVTEFCPVVQVGIRSLSLEEARSIPTLPVDVFFAKDIVGRTDWIDSVINSLSDTVYLTIDVDGLDPGIMPTTGTPEPGGLSWYEVLHLVRNVAEKRTIVGMDVVELSGSPATNAPSFLVAKLIYKTLGYVFRHSLSAA